MSDTVDANILKKLYSKKDTACENVQEEIPPQLSEAIPKDEITYKKYEKKGIALIFNHYAFDDPSLSEREGTKRDCSTIEMVTKSLGFETIVHTDLTYGEIKDALQEVSQRDHSAHTCLMVVVMSHGDDGVVHARDQSYVPKILWLPFVGKSCPSLAGKPKLFFIQACRGSKTDSGVRVAADAISGYKIPEMADLLVMYSTYEGYFSWRSGTFGSWFIQALCAELKRYGKEKDILNILTYVNYRVAYNHESNVPMIPSLHKKKQIGSIVSTLTKTFYINE